MKPLREHIQKTIKLLMEEKYPVPPEILGALENNLQLKPIVRYVDYIKAVNTVPPSYEIFLHNSQSFMLAVEQTSIVAKISSKDYWLSMNEEAEAMKALNRLLTQPLPPKIDDKEEVSDEETFDDSGGGDDVAMEDDLETEA